MSGVYRNITMCSVVPHNALDLARAYLSLVSCWAEPLSHALSTTGYLSDSVEPSLLKKYRIAWGWGTGCKSQLLRRQSKVKGLNYKMSSRSANLIRPCLRFVFFGFGFLFCLCCWFEDRISYHLKLNI